MYSADGSFAGFLDPLGIGQGNAVHVGRAGVFQVHLDDGQEVLSAGRSAEAAAGASKRTDLLLQLFQQGVYLRCPGQFVVHMESQVSGTRNLRQNLVAEEDRQMDWWSAFWADGQDQGFGFPKVDLQAAVLEMGVEGGDCGSKTWSDAGHVGTGQLQTDVIGEQLREGGVGIQDTWNMADVDREEHRTKDAALGHATGAHRPRAELEAMADPLPAIGEVVDEPPEDCCRKTDVVQVVDQLLMADSVESFRHVNQHHSGPKSLVLSR